MIRNLRFKGSWYPSDLAELEKLIEFKKNPKGMVRFGVVPHAGLFYSSSLIKIFFENLRQTTKKLLIIAPSHYHFLRPDFIYSNNFESYETPFKNLKGFPLCSAIKGFQSAIEDEHALEMILPFASYWGDLKISVALINSFTENNRATEIAKQLLNEIDEDTAVIASSDFTHYGKNFNFQPYGEFVDNELMEKTIKFDSEIADLFAKGKGSLAFQKANKQKATICGIAPIFIVSEMARLSKTQGQIEKITNSNLITNSNNSNFVSYVTILWR